MNINNKTYKVISKSEYTYCNGIKQFTYLVQGAKGAFKVFRTLDNIKFKCDSMASLLLNRK